MSSQPIEANVVLSADNSQYDQAMASSAQGTDNLGMSVDNLGAKISKLTKTAGRSLIGISAADVAVITGATAAWASYEKQVERLKAQSAILTRSQAQQTAVMKDYTAAVKGLRTSYGSTTSEAAGLVTVLSKITAVQQSSGLKDLSKVFTEMSNATGESSAGLASSLTDLQRIMGTPINAKRTRDYADQFTYLAAQTNTSAQSLIDFTTQLAPIGRSMHMTQTQVTGFATAFAKAGQDGLGVSTVFTKVATDISKSLATGSPEIAHYANLIGVSNKKFKEMDGAEQFLRILESLHEMGPRAATELERLGLDGTRSLRSITAVLNQQGGTGGLRQTLGLARQGMHSDAAGKGSDATDGLSRQFSKLREELKETAEIFGNYFAPVMSKFVGGMVAAQKVINDIAEGPMGKFVAMVMQVVAPLAGGAGALLLFAGALLKVASAFTLFRSSTAYGVREGFRGSPGIVRGPDGFMASGSHAVLGERGAEIARGGTWFQRGQYNTGQFAGSALSTIFGGASAGGRAFRSFVDPNYAQGGPRGPLSYLAGGIGRGLDSFVTPLFDQMRYRDATSRHQYVQQLTPWARAADQRALAGHMGDVGTARSQLSAIETARAGVIADPMLTNAARQAKLDEIKTLHEETSARLATSQAAEEATKSSIAATRIQTKEVSNSSRGFAGLTRGLGGVVAGATGAVAGGTAAGARMVATSPMGMPIAGMMGMAGASALGVDSSAVMLGSAGMMMGPAGAVAGALVGLGLDVASSNDAVSKSIAAVQTQADATLKTGTGFLAYNDTLRDSREATAEAYNKQAVGSRDYFLGNPKVFLGSVKNSFEGIFGKSDHQEDSSGYKSAGTTEGEAESISRMLARRSGVKLSGTQRNQRKQLDEYMSGEGARQLSEAGYDFSDLVKLRDRARNKVSADDLAGTGVSAKEINERNQNAYDRAKTRIITGGQELRDRSSGTLTGDLMLGSTAATKAIAHQGNIGLLTAAVDDIFTKALASGKSYQQVLQSTAKTQANIGDENRRQFELQADVQAKAQQALQYQMPLMTKAAAFQANISSQQSIQAGILTTPAALRTQKQDTDLQTSRAATADAFLGQAQTIQQALLMQDQYELNRSRAQEDYSLQVSYQQHDFHLQRTRAEEAYNRSRGRATADYYRNVGRAEFEFDLQRKRQQQEFDHQTLVQAKQMAMSVYDIYQRVETQRTTSATGLLANAQDQLARMRQQSEGLDKLRKMGMSDNAIQQLKLDDPANAQELTRFLGEVTPKLIKEFNKTAGKERVSAAKDLLEDPSSLSRQELLRSYNRSRSQALADHNRQMGHSREDFMRQLRQQKTDFGIMLDQQDEDFATSMSRQENQYNKTMKRAAVDLALVGKDMSGSLASIYERGATELTGNLQKQAKGALNTFNALKTSTKPVAIEMMKDLAAIFGFEYHVPAAARHSSAPGVPEAQPGDVRHPGTQIGHAAGGVVPGWTPGRDVVDVRLSGGEAIMRPEWTRAVGEKAIHAMNHQAKHGGFFLGGVMPLQNASTSQHTSGYPWAKWAGDLNYPGYADYGKPIQAWRSGIAHPFDYHADRSYGRGQVIDSGGQSSLYAHMSRVITGLAGKQVQAGQTIGYVGDYGNTGTPPTSHLHFEIRGGKIDLGDGATAGAVQQGHLRDVLKKLYPKPEDAAYKMLGAHPLNPGDISQVINRYARRAWNKMSHRYGSPGQVSPLGESVPPPPEGSQSNQDMVRKAMLEMGWHQWNSLHQLVMHESGFNNTAQNPTSSAYGMFQFLNDTWAGVGGHKTADPWKQSVYGMRYIKNRYQDPQGAWDFWKGHNWYGDGSVFTSPTTIGVGERGPEAVIPLNDRGGEFLTKAMMGSEARGIGMHAMPAGRGMSVFNTRIDRSTNFTGPITVQANDPNELLNKLQARQRVMALSRPSLTGSAA